MPIKDGTLTGIKRSFISKTDTNSHHFSNEQIEDYEGKFTQSKTTVLKVVRSRPQELPYIIPTVLCSSIAKLIDGNKLKLMLKHLNK